MPKGIYKHKKRGTQSKQTRKNIARGLMGHKVSEMTRAKMRGKNNPNYGKHTWNFGKPHSPKTRAKISEGIKGENNPRWNNGIAYAKAGYVFIRSHKHPHKDRRGYVLEHRLVVEKIIGRYLLKSEPIHHLGKTSDNRPQMLMAFISNSAHKRFEQGGKVKPEEIIFDGRKFH